MDKEKPRLAIWIAIAVLFINQLITAHQNLQSHNQMRAQIQFLQENQLEQAENLLSALEVLKLVTERLSEDITSR